MDLRKVDAEATKRAVLDALDDPGCRAILDATGHAALSATEVADACDLPLSTTYRKLELLTEADLVESLTRIRSSGKHASEYVRSVEDVVVSLGADEGAELRVNRRENPDRHLSAGGTPAE